MARPWVREHHTNIAGNRHMAQALNSWLVTKGLGSNAEWGEIDPNEED